MMNPLEFLANSAWSDFLENLDIIYTAVDLNRPSCPPNNMRLMLVFSFENCWVF